MDTKEWVKTWLESCDQNGILPWRFDFKQFYMEEVFPIADTLDNMPHFEAWLKYKYTDLLNNGKSNAFTDALERVQENKKIVSDPDKVAFPIYNVLGWQTTDADAIRGESMNSFRTTLTPCITSSTHSSSPFSAENEKTFKSMSSEVFKLDEILKKWASNGDVANIKKFQINKENQLRIERHETTINLLNEMEKFALLTHSIGNFTVMLSWVNQGRGMGNVKDYWDLTLNTLQEFFMSGKDKNLGSNFWKNFIEQYYLQPFVTSDYAPCELWDGHFTKQAMPQTTSDFEQFYRNVNLLIEERGKQLTKELCKKLDLVDLQFYKDHLLNLGEIKFFEALIEQA
ncbi:hypothetical protein [Latilactobacillus sakei]|uniref:hypothetical protein n=1 Tax=Latilactobacillus sakei TaxID=1599 RepID=UPI000DC6447B|nr:hypothetical protein [Latilactobacillus sakei]SPS07506.1 hypothetical protein LAS9624_01761 [Latilactobacillus sakei]